MTSNTTPKNATDTKTPPPLPSTITAPLPASLGDEWATTPGRPFRRFFARSIDTTAFMCLFYTVFVLSTLILGDFGDQLAVSTLLFLGPVFEHPLGAIFSGLVMLLILALPIAYYIGRDGASIGKKLMGIKILRDGEALGFDNAFRRELGVIWRGQGLGIPLVMFFTQLWQLIAVWRRGYASWDQKLGSVVAYRKIGFLQLAATFIGINFLFGILFGILTMVLVWDLSLQVVPQ